MILTVTMNPSIDISYPIKKLNIDDINRVVSFSKTAGGKGINVSRVLNQLGAPVMATGIVGGHFGNYLVQQLDEDSIQHSFTKINGDTRMCIAILHEGQQTEILESGPNVSHSEYLAFISNFEDLLDNTNLITISGNLPEGFNPNTYSVLIEKAARVGIKVLLDTSGTTLKRCIESSYKPFLIKPNETEISDLIGKKIHNEIELIEALESSLFDNIEWVVVTLGAKGAVIKNKKEYYRVEIPSIKVNNPVGSGDSTIAGLAYAMYNQNSPEVIIKTGMATGMLNAQEEKTGSININNFNSLFEQIQVKKIHH